MFSHRFGIDSCSVPHFLTARKSDGLGGRAKIIKNSFFNALTEKVRSTRQNYLEQGERHFRFTMEYVNH